MKQLRYVIKQNISIYAKYVDNLYQYLQGELPSVTSLVIILFLLIVLWEKQARQVTRSTIILGGAQSLENRKVKTQEQLETVGDGKTIIIRYFDNF